MNHIQHIEALLFMRGEPVSFKEMGKLLEIPVAEAQLHTKKLAEELEGRGVAAVLTETHAELKTAPTVAEFMMQLAKEELGATIGKASLETLAIILYKGPVTRQQVEYIRGVNASTALRTLQMRGLIARSTQPENQRTYVYEPTTELLGHLGVTTLSELPSYEDFVKELTALEETAEEHATRD